MGRNYILSHLGLQNGRLQWGLDLRFQSGYSIQPYVGYESNRKYGHRELAAFWHESSISLIGDISIYSSLAGG